MSLKSVQNVHPFVWAMVVVMFISASLIGLTDLDPLWQWAYRGFCFVMTVAILTFETWRIEHSEKDYEKLCKELEAKK